MKRIIIFTLSLLVAVGLSTRIWYINTHVDPQFTPPKTEIYQMGEWVELDGDFQFSADESTKGYAVKLENIEFMSPKDYAARYGLELSAFYSLDDTLPEFVADLTLNFRNTGNDEGYIQFVYYRIYSEKDLRSFYPLADVNALQMCIRDRISSSGYFCARTLRMSCAMTASSLRAAISTP